LSHWNRAHRRYRSPTDHFTSSGTTVARISRKRPSLPILAIAPDLGVARRMALMDGAHGVHTEEIHSYEEMVSLAEVTVRSEECVRRGEVVVVSRITS